MSEQPPKVAYILGVYRSGTTLLSGLMGQLDGFFCVGELRAIWRELNLPTARCGCGSPLIDCDTWQRILEKAFGGVSEARLLAPRILRLQNEVFGRSRRWRRVPGLLRQRDMESAGDPLKRYAEALSNLYRAIAAVTGARVIVDSSKEPTDAALLRLVPDVASFFVHIVRDPRGNVFSSRRALSNPARRYETARVGYSAMSWVAGNVAASAVRRADGVRSLLIRYEDLVERPRYTLELIARSVDESVPVPHGEDGTIIMAPTHTVCGNENRFRTGPVKVVEDTAWRDGLDPGHRLLVSLICAPFLRRYGYRPR